MKLRWSFRAANDRAQQSESQVPSLGPFIEKYLLKSKCFFLLAYWSRIKGEGPGFEVDRRRWREKGDVEEEK